MNFDQIIQMIQEHEGFRPELYRDSVGVLTGGFGHAFTEGSRLPYDVCYRLLWNDLHTAYQDYQTLNLGLSANREAVIVDMLFNLGLTRFSRFKRFLSALMAEDYDTAASEMLDSLWAKQVGNRAVQLARMMREDISYDEVKK